MEDFSTLLLGATGTGKSAAATAIGRSGHIPYDHKAGTFEHSFKASFSAINLSQYPENLIESELFGHRKGAFTGAIDHHKGVFERCVGHGTLFLDEIGDVSIPIQIKLLNILQERLYTPVGSHEIKRFSGRVVAATNHSLDQMRVDGRFREDFYYRLCSDVIYMPSLHQRLMEYPGEMELLVKDLIEKMFATNSSAVAETVMQALEKKVLKNYTWPGNVRELSQAIRRILLVGDYNPQLIVDKSRPEWLKQASQGELAPDELLGFYYKLLYEKSGRSYKKVAEKAGVNWRTVKKYLSD